MHFPQYRDGDLSKNFTEISWKQKDVSDTQYV
jgi:hypothetical protein